MPPTVDSRRTWRKGTHNGTHPHYSSVITEKYNFPGCDPQIYLVMFDAPGFGPMDIVQGFYERTQSGVKLKELVKIGEFKPEE